MTVLRNALFIMVDQLRWDHVGAYGVSSVPTPHMDALARRGALMRHAFVQGPVCGPSRMSYYTGRYVLSHGARWNRVPLSSAEKTLGDYLRPLGVRATLAGKSHVLPDTDALDRAGIEIESERGALLREGGFTPIERFDGHSRPDGRSGYADFLRAAGYAGEDPWSAHAISVQAPDGSVHSGWSMRHAHLPARVRAEHSETAYLSDRAIDFIQAQDEKRWCLHLSYVKPHWPYVAPAPYHAMFRGAPQSPVVKAPHERTEAHPVVRAFQQHEESLNFGQDAIAAHVKPTYMGLVAQLDEEIGRVMAALEASGQAPHTLVVLCADHGDMLGDHWLGEKELFYEAAVRVPLIVVDPRPEADATRGQVLDPLVEAIDVLPTLLEALGADPDGWQHCVEGRSLLPLLHGRTAPWRDAVFSEADYAYRAARWTLGRAPGECRGTMVRTGRWKYVDWEGFRPQLFDLHNDPDELHDLGADPPAAVEREMRERLLQWSLRRKNRTTVPDSDVAQRTEAVKRHGIHIGVW
ncbi:arylsulfatase A-like enzyme [Pseudacidovorax intermedius]|uniref:Arylsulfatase A-like enzyme n=1 Tax=Pseudacidovorax intermedius TaxID=433924 RepID=A0A370FNE8_9BURK|nr:sulfatase-like hydrolase/transferase [Pseudacidovorax intermedius]RDI29252.1 arylsulfatase A-like enzyme [Pseudacidovorax intermedius]